ncbi:MAG: hypothetical protein HY896_09945 [Deltaproteobacteria bacterium]|nr:hypothetical protein [Deltaproteobacteria bacterium]
MARIMIIPTSIRIQRVHTITIRTRIRMRAEPIITTRSSRRPTTRNRHSRREGSEPFEFGFLWKRLGLEKER